MARPSKSLDTNAARLLSGRSLLQVHKNADKALPKVGSKEFMPSNSWLEKKQIESLLQEKKSLLEEERVEKWGSLAGACWKQSIKLAEVTRRIGRYFNTMGFEREGKLYLYPEEALYLLETNSLELLFGGVPVSLQQAYALLLGCETGCSVNEYRAYSHLVRQGFRVLRPTKKTKTTQYERHIRLNQHAVQKRLHPGNASQIVNSRSHQSCNFSKVDDSRSNNDPLKEEIMDQTERNTKSIVACDDFKDKDKTKPNLEEEKHRFQMSSSGEKSSCNSNSSECVLNAESQAYGIAKSLVSLGTDLMMDDTVTSNGGNNLSKDMNGVLCKQIIQVLRSHFDKNVSEETLESVAMSAAESILSHGVSSASGENDDSHAPEKDHFPAGQVSAFELQDEKSKESEDNIEFNTLKDSPQPDGGTTLEEEDSTRVKVVDSACIQVEESISVHGKDNISLLEDDSTSVPVEDGTSVQVEDSISLQEEDGTSVQVEDSISLQGEDSTSVPFEDSISLLEEDSTSVPVEDSVSFQEDDSISLQEEDSTSVQVEDSISLQEDDDSTGVQVEGGTSGQVQQSTTMHMEDSTVLLMKRPLTTVISSREGLSTKAFSSSMPIKRRQPGEVFESETNISKKAKLVNLSDSEIEILDVELEKKVEVIDLSDDDSNINPRLLKSESKHQVLSKREVIDVDIASQSDSDSSNSGSSDGSAQNSSDSSIICIETKKHQKSAHQRSSYQKLFDTRRRMILNSFPCMYKMNEIILTAPDPELLPEHVQPNHSTYKVNRWKLAQESKQDFELTQPERMTVPHNLNMNQWVATAPPNFLLGDVPSNPWALMQTLALLLLPFTNQAPQLQQRWPHNISNWTNQAPSWPRPSWPRPSYFKPYQQRWHPRPQGSRYHSRFPRPNHSYSRSFCPRPRFMSFSQQPEHIKNFQPQNNDSSSGSHKTQGGHSGTSNLFNNAEGTPNSLQFEEHKSVMRGMAHPRGRRIQRNFVPHSKKKEKNSFKGSPRYFNPPRKYHHMNFLKKESDHTFQKNLKSEKNITMEDTVSSSSEESGSSLQDHVDMERREQDGDVEEHSTSTDSLCDQNNTLLLPNHCSNFESVCQALQVIQRADSKLLGTMKSSDVLSLQFDVFPPNVSFKKGSPPTPSYHLCIMDVNDPVPSTFGISFLLKKLDDRVPILFAIVHPDSISFLQFLDVSVPFLPIDL